jgi:Ca2+-binding EF-hand superfamily protein
MSYRALSITPSSDELSEFLSILDPDDEGFAIYSSFVAICALKLHSQSRSSESHTKEVDEAWRLFTKGTGEERITLATLKKVAKALKEDVDEGVLKDMILEANGGTGVAQGVERKEFDAVLRRAGAWR